MSTVTYFRLFVFLSLLVGFPLLLFAQTTGKIAGSITDASSGEPLAGTNVFIRGTQMGAAADIDGDFFILKVPPGTYEVEANLVGYTPMVQTEVRVQINHTSALIFELKVQILEGEVVTVVAERPVVDKQLTASKQVMSADEFEKSFVTNIEDAVATQQGVNIHGGIRGGFLTDVKYMLDGLSVRDGSSSSNYSAFNTSSIQELEVLTGGYNAEYGQASGAVVNAVTKTARDRMHGSVIYRTRPAGIYHWGGYMYDDDVYENRIIATTPEYWENYQIPNWMDPETTPEELMAYYRDNILNPPGSEVFKNYNDRWSQEIEATLYGPIGEDWTYMVSGRYLKDAPKFPQQFEYNPSWHGEIDLNYDLSTKSRLGLKAFHGGHNNSGFARTFFNSSEDMRSAIGDWSPINEGYIVGAYDQHKYYPWRGNHWQGLASPEYLEVWGGQLKFTHTFNPTMLLEANLSYFQFDRLGSRRNGGAPQDYNWTSRALDPVLVDSSAGIIPIPPEMYLSAQGINYNGPAYGLGNVQNSYSTNNSIDIDFLWQINKYNQIKAGIYASTQYVNRYIRNAAPSSREIRLNDIIPNDYHPYEGGFFLQDKIETEGMIINVGVRVDMYNLNKWVSADPYDPLQIDEDTKGNLGQNVISIGDVFTRRGVSESDNRDGSLVHTATQWAVSPRIGISHPITETTVLHFMYGHFNQRPPWNKLGAYPSIFFGALPYSSFEELVPIPVGFFESDDYNGLNYDIHWSFYGGNPALTFEKVIQYEIGFDQAIGEALRLDVTVYYRDGKDLTSIGFTSSTFNDFGLYPDGGHVWMHPDVSHPTVYKSKTRSGNFRMWANNGYMDVRGLEITLDSRITNYGSLRLHYDRSFSKTGRYGPYQLFREIPEGAKFDPTITKAVGAQDTYFGGNNLDNHQSGNENEHWHPNNTLKLMGNFFTPEKFGPEILGIYWLGDWNLNFQTTWAQGRRYTWYDPTQPSTGFQAPLNRRWKDQWNTNLSLIKGFSIGQEQRVYLAVKIFNLFNDQWLRLPAAGSARDQYELEGILPTISVGYDEFQEDVDNVWSWYELAQLPREVLFEIGFQF